MHVQESPTKNYTDSNQKNNFKTWRGITVEERLKMGIGSATAFGATVRLSPDRMSIYHDSNTCKRG